jgi:hypothetical protein
MSTYYSPESEEYIDQHFATLCYVLRKLKLIKTDPLGSGLVYSETEMYNRLMRYA